MKFWAKSEYGRLVVQYPDKLREDVKRNDKAWYLIERYTPESRRQRGFYHGAVLTLWLYLNGMDYRDNSLKRWLHECAKNEFNGEIVKLDGKLVKRGKSTKGLLNKGFIEKVIEHLEEQYGIDRTKVLNPEHYKYFRDVIYPSGEYETYIDYLLALKLLK
jgi:hypothetical protein